MENQNQINPPPEDLAGYQNVVTGLVEHGDIIVDKATREKKWVNELWIGVMLPLVFHDVYRKMPCPKAGDHDKAWRDAQLAAQQRRAESEFADAVRPKAKTNDDGKPPLAYLPWGALREVAKVQAYGHKKYGDFFNYKKGMEVGRNVSCSMRHLADFMDGNDLDNESRISHLAHAACRALFALQNLLDKTAVDDRYKKP